MTSKLEASKCFKPFLTTCAESLFPSSPKTSTLAFSHIVFSCVSAPGRKVSAPITATLYPDFVKNLASLAVIVVLPLPWIPSKSTLFSFPGWNEYSFSVPRSFESSSYSIFTIWSFLDSPGGGVSLSDRSSIFFVISKTSLTLTSACKRARWMSFASSLINASSIPEEFTNFFSAALRPFFKLSSIVIVTLHRLFQIFLCTHPRFCLIL